MRLQVADVNECGENTADQLRMEIPLAESHSLCNW